MPLIDRLLNAFFLFLEDACKSDFRRKIEDRIHAKHKR
jgi:hypothetical protein